MNSPDYTADTLRFFERCRRQESAHVAAGFVGGCNVLVSWNFRHIANVRRAERFNAIAEELGYPSALSIVSPGEVLYGTDQA